MSWEGKRVLVTGADGFIGSHLAEALVESGADVTAFCLYNSNGTLGWLDETSDQSRRAMQVRRGDIRDARFVEEACGGVSIVFHLAALIAIPYSYHAPQSFVDTNVGGTLNMLEAARRNGCERFVHTSTSEVYGTPDKLPITESHPLKAQSPYSASKIAADKLCEAYFHSYELPVTTIRPFNTYGPRQSARAVVPTILAQALSKRPTVRLGNMSPKRDLTYVTDTVRGLVAAGEAEGIEGRTIQLGSGRADSIADLVGIISKICGVDLKVEEEPARKRPPSSEVMVLQSDPSLARELLGWQAETSLEDGLRRTAEWMRGNLARYAPDQYAI